MMPVRRCGLSLRGRGRRGFRDLSQEAVEARADLVEALVVARAALRLYLEHSPEARALGTPPPLVRAVRGGPH